MGRTPNLRDAYSLSSKEGIKKLYETWAQSYDTGFGVAEGYDLPRAVATAFVTAGGTGPVLDVGAGTGLIAEHLNRLSVGPLDALDLSEDMLGVARAKGLYRALHTADVTQPLPADWQGVYQGVVSAGTFTFGHVGPEGLDPLLDIAPTGCVFVISVNAKHYVESGFESKFALLDTDIYDLTLSEVRIYDDRADPAHRDDTAYIATFRKA